MPSIIPQQQKTESYHSRPAIYLDIQEYVLCQPHAELVSGCQQQGSEVLELRGVPVSQNKRQTCILCKAFIFGGQSFILF